MGAVPENGEGASDGRIRMEQLEQTEQSSPESNSSEVVSQFVDCASNRVSTRSQGKSVRVSCDVYNGPTFSKNREDHEYFTQKNQERSWVEKNCRGKRRATRRKLFHQTPCP